VATIASPSSILPSAEQRERRFYMVMTAVIGVVTVAGFAVNIAAGRAVADPPPIFHVHALAYIAWLALFLAQSVFVTRNDIKAHRLLGTVALAWLPVMVILSLAMTIASIRIHGGPPVFAVGEFLWVNAMHAIGFAALTGVAIGMWRKTDWHRRLMLVALAWVGAPGIARLLPLPLFIPHTYVVLLIAAMLFPACALLVDWRRTGKVHPAWLWGIASVFAALFIGEALAASGWGVEVTRGLIEGTPGAERPMEAFFPGAPPAA
jgi:hypothetical protein